MNASQQRFLGLIRRAGCPHSQGYTHLISHHRTSFCSHVFYGGQDARTPSNTSRLPGVRRYFVQAPDVKKASFDHWMKKPSKGHYFCPKAMIFAPKQCGSIAGGVGEQCSPTERRATPYERGVAGPATEAPLLGVAAYRARLAVAQMGIFVVSGVVVVGHVRSVLPSMPPCFLESAPFRRRDPAVSDKARAIAAQGARPPQVHVSALLVTLLWQIPSVWGWFGWGGFQVFQAFFDFDPAR